MNAIKSAMEKIAEDIRKILVEESYAPQLDYARGLADALSIFEKHLQGGAFVDVHEIKHADGVPVPFSCMSCALRTRNDDCFVDPERRSIMGHIEKETLPEWCPAYVPEGK